jgi:hypothetical protein
MQNIQQPTKPTQQGDCGCNDPATKDSATQASINVLRSKYCELVYSTEGEVEKQQQKFVSEKALYESKTCIFNHTEENYRRYRNFEITAGTELLQTNESVKANVTQLKTWNTALNGLLVNIAKQVKDLKGKYTDLKDAACKLETSYGDSCNIAQRKVLTGTTASKEKCNDTTTVVDGCQNTDKDITQLITTGKCLAHEADTLFQVGSDVIGIQLFSNIDTLDQLQKDLSTKSSAFDTTIATAMKTRKTDVDTLQGELVTSVKALTRASMDRNWQRSVFEGYTLASEFLCCPECAKICPPPDPAKTPTQEGTDNCNDCPPLLGHYEDCICKICGQVQKTFCCDQPSTPQTPPKDCD